MLALSTQTAIEWMLEIVSLSWKEMTMILKKNNNSPKRKVAQHKTKNNSSGNADSYKILGLEMYCGMISFTRVSNDTRLIKKLS